MPKEKFPKKEPAERKMHFREWQADLERRAKEVAKNKGADPQIEQLEAFLGKRSAPEGAGKNQKEPEEIKRLQKDGWEVVDILHNKANVNIADFPVNEEVRVEAFGTTFYVLKRKKQRATTRPEDEEPVY